MDKKPAFMFTGMAFILTLLFFHVWCSSHYKEISFEITKINQQKEVLKEKKRALKIELARLKSPERIEKLKASLDLRLPKSSQIERIK